MEHYVNIEKVRFPDMNIEYEVETTEFALPALSVQPLAEKLIELQPHCKIVFCSVFLQQGAGVLRVTPL